MADRDLININAAFRRIERTSKKTGITKKKGFKVDFVADDLIFNSDAKEMNAILADGIKGILEEQFRNTSKAAASTIARRRRAQRGRQDTKWYRKRYLRGNKTTQAQPSDSVRLFVDSGKLSQNMALRARKTSGGTSVITLNVPAARFDPQTFGTEGEMQEMFRVLKREVPILDGRTTKGAGKAISKVVDEISKVTIANNEAKIKALRRQLRRQFAGLGKELLGFLS